MRVTRRLVIGLIVLLAAVAAVPVTYLALHRPPPETLAAPAQVAQAPAATLPEGKEESIMSLAEDLGKALQELGEGAGQRRKCLERFQAEVQFARQLAASRPERAQWERLLVRALKVVKEAVGRPGPLDIEGAVGQAEALLAPLGAAAKQYTVHCVGHAHIDMNWMWSWPETVSVTHDTFATMDRLMAEFPDFTFAQSQASVYEAMQRYSPEVFAALKKRVAEGRWEVIAATWVEGDKNLASGEIMCRHLLYTKRWLRDNLGLPLEAVKIDWECDTFGHAHTVPGLLRQAGVTRYYHHRAGVGRRLYWWQGKDGARVLAYDDAPYGYNGSIGPHLGQVALDFERATGLRDVLWIYGVGDHGGGPTRQAILTIREINSWPIFPKVRMSTTDQYFTLVERQADKLPVIDQELNFVFRGCYSSQSNVKTANRLCENACVEAEGVALLARAAAGFTYPKADLAQAWRMTMFNQFHDILPGSGVRDTYQYAQGLMQETLAITQSVRTRALGALARQADTGWLAGRSREPGPGLGAGVGDGAWYGQTSKLGAGAAAVEPMLVYNPSPWGRAELVRAKIWNREWAQNRLVVVGPQGGPVAAQVVDRGDYWGHRFVEVAFPAAGLPAMGYRVYGIKQAPEPLPAGGVSVSGWTMENERLRLEVEPASGAIIHLVDKKTGYDLVPPGRRLGLLQVLQEAPHGMTAWEIGQILHTTDLAQDGRASVTDRGPYLARIETAHRYHDSTLRLAISLAAGGDRVEMELDADWLERGTPQVGVPMLKVAFPVAAADATASYEIPAGYITRRQDGQDVPALTWADLTGAGQGAKAPARVGLAVLNQDKYGYDAQGEVLRLTLIRSSYDPDPLPEMGRHLIRFALVPHVGAWDPARATRAGFDYNHPLSVVATDAHKGRLPAEQSFLQVSPGNVMIMGTKQAEDSGALVIRLYEVLGRRTKAQVRIDPSLAGPTARAVQTDLLERPTKTNTAAMQDGVLTVSLPAYGVVTVKVEAK